MNILVTGAKGFIGKNLISELRNHNFADLFEYDLDTDPMVLEIYCQQAEFVFHLAGVNRPQDQSEFMAGNCGFTARLLETLRKHKNTCPVMLASSIQALLDNAYGRSKKAGEDLLFAYARETGARVLIYRFPNIFGKWCRPNYNSVIATYSYNIARGLPIQINDPNTVLTLAYIDDVVAELLNALNGKETSAGRFCEVPDVHTTTLGETADLLQSFHESRTTLAVPNVGDQFTKKLYNTYLSYLPRDQFSYQLTMKTDHRGAFTEFLKPACGGQVSVNITKPGITKGNHWHHSKNEKFLVVSGRGVIRFREVGGTEVKEYHVCGENMEVVDIPPGYIHNLENLGDTDMVTIMWASESFDPDKPDTYYMEV